MRLIRTASGALLTLALAAPGATDDRSWLEPAEPMRLVGPIHFVGTQGLAVYLITTSAGHLLLGGGMPPSGPAIEASIRRLGYRPEDVKLLLSNHAHVDHVGTLAYLKKATGAAVLAMDRDVDLLASGGDTDYLFARNPRFHFPPVATDRVLHDGDVVRLGGVELTARLTPGHTRGSTTFVTTVEDAGRSYVVVFPDGTGVNPGTRLVRRPSYAGILEDYRRTIRLLESLTPDVFLSYHTDDFGLPAKRARAATEGARAFVDPEGYRLKIAAAKANIERLAAQEESAPPKH
ncbi:MAG TPA: subclass B3 metallo-beta-lactamase [Vicinamibacteria bacterium]|nr:subclass B3 metallo-beta-lactamase [Vicinamibacteria bacterium]